MPASPFLFPGTHFDDDVEAYDDERHLHRAVARWMIYASVGTYFFLRHVQAAPWGKTAPRSAHEAAHEASSESKKRNFARRRSSSSMSCGSSSWGHLIHPRLTWVVMESPNLFWAVVCFVHRDVTVMPSVLERANANQILFAMFCLHYVNRTIVYPLRLSDGTKPMPLGVGALAFLYTSINGYLQCRHLCSFGAYPERHHLSGQFLTGVAVWLVGLAANIHADATLRNLRRPGETGYKIPRGGLFEYVSSAHYLGEILEWIGYALAGQSLATTAFACYTAGNLIPRGLSAHDWYLRKFENYPADRKAVIPFIL